MAITIKTYKNFSKRINSTKQPSGGTNVNVVLKAGTSIENPIFLIDGIDLDVNYVKWNDHYYYVSDIILGNKNIYEIQCTQDILATYKTAITGTTAFVEYSTTNFNANLLDTRISNTGSVSRSSNTNAALEGFFDTGHYIVSVVGTSGIANRYIMSAANINTMMTYINTVPNDNVLDAVVKKYGSLLDCVIGCTWVPFSPDNDNIDYPVVLGGYTISGLSCKRCSSTMVAHTYTTSINIPWVNSGEISRKSNETMCLYLPAYGLCNLEASKYVGLTSLTINMVADITGAITYGIVNNGGTVDYFNCNVGAQVPITQYTQSPIGMGLGALGGRWAQGQSADKLGVSPFVSDMYKTGSSILGRLQNVNSSASSVGGQGSIATGAMAQLHDIITLTNYSYGYSEEQADMATALGRPLMAIKSLASLTGYVKCNGASVSIDGLANDRDAVNGYLNSGIYIE